MGHLVSSCFYCKLLMTKHDEEVLLQDWNQFLESISNLHFCVPGNGSAEGELNPFTRKKSDRQSGNSKGIEQRSLLVPLLLKGDAGGETPRFLSTSLLGNQVGLKGAYFDLLIFDLLHG